MLLCLASFLVWLFISLSHLCSSISLSRCLVMSVYVLVVRFNFIQSSPIPIFSNKLLIFLLQRALFSLHLMSLYAIWDNLFSFLVEVRSYIGLQFSAHLHGFEKGLTGKRTLQIPTEISSLLYYSPRVNDRLDRERLSVISSVQRQCNGTI